MTRRGRPAGRRGRVCGPPPPPPPPPHRRGARSPEASPGTHAFPLSKSRAVRRRGWTGPCFRGWPGRARSTLRRALVGLGRRTRLFLTRPQLPESRSGGGDRLEPSWVPRRGRSGTRARSLVRARSSRWGRLADGSFFFSFFARRSQIPVRRHGRAGRPTRVGGSEAASASSPASSLSLGVRAPTFAATRPPPPQSTR